MAAQLKIFKDPDSDDKKIAADSRNKIIYNLKTIKVSDSNINKILTAVDKMPGTTHLLGALKFLTELTDKHSECEEHYIHSDYISEYFCTLSNLGFFAVAYYYNDYATLFSATFSALSHAIPLKRLNELDKIAAVTVFLTVISQYDLLAKNPGIIAAGLATFSIGALDALAGRPNLDKFGPTFHVVWHLAAAFSLYKFNQAQAEVTVSDIKTITTAVTQNKVPEYLQYFYNTFSAALSEFANTNRGNQLST